jgi:PAS domain S-box-containing protein
MLPAEIVESVSSALVSMLDAELVFVTVGAAALGTTLQHGHTRIGPASGMLPGIRKALAGWLPGNASLTQTPISNPFGGGQLYVASARVGFGGDAAIVAGSLDPAFPNYRQRLLLDIAADETAIGLHHWNTEGGQHRFTSLVERSSDFIGIADLKGRPTYVNPAGRKLVGLDSEEVSGLKIADFVAESDQTRLEHEVWPFFLREGRWSGELKLRHFRERADIPVLVDWFYIDDPRTRRPMNIATVSIDLRLMKAAEAELRSMNDTLETRVTERTTALAEVNEKLRLEIIEGEKANKRLEETRSELFHAARLSAVGQTAATLAHELSQPLSATTNSLGATARFLASSRPGSMDLAREAVTMAAQQAARANEIIKRLRNFVARGKASRRMESLHSMLDQALQFALIGTDSLGIKVTVDFHREASVAFVDRIQIEQVLVNLVRNAIEAMADGDGGELTIQAAPAPGEMVEIVVSDRGPGLTTEVSDHLFEPFTTTKRKGMGLGLSICKTIVHAHGGAIRTAPNPGGGTIFAFTLQTGQEGR